jgi:hypothetical protein
MPELTWVKGSNYHIKSECENYKISKSGPDDDVQFSAWHKGNASALGVFSTSQEAKETCQGHADLDGLNIKKEASL